MSRSNSEKLKLAISDAKSILGENIEQPQKGVVAKSKLNQLIGNRTIESFERKSLISGSVKPNSEIDSIADHILGKASKERKPILKLKNDSEEFGEKFSQRVAAMRENAFSPLSRISTNVDEEAGIFGKEDDGRDVWQAVVNRESAAAFEDLNQKSLFSEPIGVEKSTTVTSFTHKGVTQDLNFRTWIDCKENKMATNIANALVSNPGKINPLVIFGASGSGKTHLVQAIANGFKSRFDGHVRIISDIELQSNDLYSEIDIDLLSEHSLIAFDGLNLIENSSIDQNKLGSFIDLALNLGVQIVLTSKVQVSEWENSRLWELFKDAVIANLGMPDLTSRIRIIRRLIALNGLLLDNSQINRLADLSENWKDLKSNVNLISIAIQEGVEVISPSDIDRVLQGNVFIEDDEIIPEETSLQDEAKEILDAVVDVVYDKQAVGGIELVSDLPELEDDWEPSEIDVDSMIKDGRSLAEKYVKTGLDEMIPAPPNVLSLDERDKFLIQRKEELDINDLEEVVETMVDFDLNIEDRISDAEKQLAQDFELISTLEQKIREISEIPKDATIEELMAITDSIKEIEDRILGIEIEDDELQVPSEVETQVEEEKVEPKKPSKPRKKVRKPKKKKD
ncbi:MAG: DnaA ATPase domain-containing protein [Candidatus Poseidoniaceae archaeon]